MTSNPMIAMLIAHIDGAEVQVVRRPSLIGAHSNQTRVLDGLLARGFIRYTDKDAKFTKITDGGRRELARMLAIYADMLSRAGCGDIFRGETSTRTAIELRSILAGRFSGAKPESRILGATADHRFAEPASTDHKHIQPAPNQTMRPYELKT